MLALAEDTRTGTILLVEDDAADAEYVRDLLEGAVSDLVRAPTLRSAIGLIADTPFEAVLLDLRLPDGSGVECVDAIRSAAGEIPVVVLTGMNDQALALRCLAAGAQDYLSKNELNARNLHRSIRYAAARAGEKAERSRAERLQARLAVIVGASDDAIISGTSDGTIASWNRAAEAIFGVAAAQAIGQPIARFLGQDDADLVLRAAAVHGPAFEISRARVPYRDQRLSISAFDLPDEGGRLGHFGAICRDVTEKYRREEELREQYAALQARDRQMRALAARVNSVREEEQQRIAREVHDELGQLLTAIRMDLHWVERHLAEDATPAIQQVTPRLVEARQLVELTVGAVQRIASQLRPNALDVLGLAAAMKDEIARFQMRLGAVFESHIRYEPTPPPDVATAFFRIFQEILTNIARHAQARRVWVDFEALETEWRLTVRDDGRGFSRLDPGVPTLGLLGMRERAELLGGRLEIDGSAGTTVVAHIPR